jgi:hypothetical protein
VNRIFDIADRYIVGGFALVALYLVATHPNGFNALLQNGFGGVNAGFKILQGR